MYALRSSDFITFDICGIEIPFVIRDWENFSEKDLPKYFQNGYHTFVEAFRSFRFGSRKLTEEEEKELKFMLEALIDAKNQILD